MKFLKNFFNDESTIVGLCRFDSIKQKYNKNVTTSGLENDFFFNPFQTQQVFETNISRNALLL